MGLVRGLYGCRGVDVHAICKYDDSLLCIILPEDPQGNA